MLPSALPACNLPTVDGVFPDRLQGATDRQLVLPPLRLGRETSISICLHLVSSVVDDLCSALQQPLAREMLALDWSGDAMCLLQSIRCILGLMATKQNHARTVGSSLHRPILPCLACVCHRLV